jgi:hypothetical protein
MRTRNEQVIQAHVRKKEKQKRKSKTVKDRDCLGEGVREERVKVREK